MLEEERKEKIRKMNANAGGYGQESSDRLMVAKDHHSGEDGKGWDNILFPHDKTNFTAVNIMVSCSTDKINESLNGKELLIKGLSLGLPLPHGLEDQPLPSLENDSLLRGQPFFPLLRLVDR